MPRRYNQAVQPGGTPSCTPRQGGSNTIRAALRARTRSWVSLRAASRKRSSQEAISTSLTDLGESLTLPPRYRHAAPKICKQGGKRERSVSAVHTRATSGSWKGGDERSQAAVPAAAAHKGVVAHERLDGVEAVQELAAGSDGHDVPAGGSGRRRRWGFAKGVALVQDARSPLLLRPLGSALADAGARVSLPTD